MKYGDEIWGFMAPCPGMPNFVDALGTYSFTQYITSSGCGSIGLFREAGYTRSTLVAASNYGLGYRFTSTATAVASQYVMLECGNICVHDHKVTAAMRIKTGAVGSFRMYFGMYKNNGNNKRGTARDQGDEFVGFAFDNISVTDTNLMVQSGRGGGGSLNGREIDTGYAMANFDDRIAFKFDRGSTCKMVIGEDTLVGEFDYTAGDYYPGTSPPLFPDWHLFATFESGATGTVFDWHGIIFRNEE